MHPNSLRVFAVSAATCAVAVFTATAFAPVAEAQPANVRFGIAAGVNSASISDLDNSAELGTSGTKRRLGLQAGVFANIPLGGRVSLQPEVWYVQKGAGTEFDGGFDGEEPVNLDLTLELSYFEAPVLLRLDLGDAASRGARPFLEAGPAFAFRSGCNVNTESDGVSIDLDCDEFTDGESVFRDFDASIIVGGGVAFPLAGRSASVGLRYSQGLTTIVDDPVGSNPRNGVIAGIFSIRF